MKNILPVLMVIFFLTEAIGKFYIYEQGDSIWLAAAVKGFVFVWMGLSLFGRSKTIWHIILLSACFCIGQFFLDQGFDKKVIINTSKYLLPLIMLGYFSIYPLENSGLARTFKTFEWLLIINFFFILLGIIFDINLLTSYKDDRFGFNGLFITSYTASYTYGIALLYLIYRYKSRLIYNPLTYIIVLSCVLVGTKAALALLLIALLSYFMIHVPKKYFKWAFIAVLLFGMLGAYLFLFKNQVISSVFKSDGFWSAALSNRDKLFLEKTWPFISENWSLMNWVFGGIGEMGIRPQMAIIDVPLFFGIMGGILYFKSYCNHLLNGVSSKNLLLPIAAILVLALISGNFFINATIAVYIVILRLIIVDESIKHGV